MILINKEKVEDLIYKQLENDLSKDKSIRELLKEIIDLKYYDFAYLNLPVNDIIDQCMKVQEYLILKHKLKEFIKMIENLPDDTNKGSIWKKVFNNRLGEELKEIVL